MSNKTCGTCKWFKILYPKTMKVPDCKYPKKKMPLAVRVNDYFFKNAGENTDATDCQCYKQQEESC